MTFRPAADTDLLSGGDVGHDGGEAVSPGQHQSRHHHTDQHGVQEPEHRHPVGLQAARDGESRDEILSAITKLNYYVPFIIQINEI